MVKTMATPRIRMILALGLAATLLTGTALAQPGPGGMGGAPGGMMMGPVSVGVVTLERQAVPFRVELPGRAAASLTAEVRPQVGGIVREVAFTAGSPVVAGDILYRIDDSSYAAQLAAAQAGLQRANAAVPAAQATVTRLEGLVKGGGVSQSEVDSARATLLQAQADVASAEASVRSAQINVDLATIEAPIAGVIGISSVDPGALVTANQGDALTTIRQLDPIILELVDTSANLLRIRQRVETGTLSGDRNAAPQVRVTLEDGSQLESVGQLLPGDPVVSQTTGTFTMRVQINNPNRILVPGMFVRATIDVGSENAYLVPQRAVSRNDAGEATAYFVNTEGKAEQRVLTTARVLDNSWVVTAGVSDGDKLIVDGLQKISNGAEVSPIEVTIDENGVVPQTIEAPSGGQPPAEANGAPPAASAGQPAGATPEAAK